MKLNVMKIDFSTRSKNFEAPMAKFRDLMQQQNTFYLFEINFWSKFDPKSRSKTGKICSYCCIPRVGLKQVNSIFTFQTSPLFSPMEPQKNFLDYTYSTHQ